ncbi:hypothetical protein A9257_10200 [Vibrio cyclitrophicus]|uniref:hypothetical protein n=1 Tax=Vibrio cyclitrophicus TaxID=47951 RepID=UPI0007EEA8B2|nr:hypothetical protein [Vibrio cyclitrophicus]OBS96769.1 hypothetical protein A9257_10200 [Vibrio cyclitrophicus]
MTTLKISEDEIHVKFATPSQLDCQFSKNKLDVITLDLQNLNIPSQELVEGWLAAGEVDVINPFTEREYKAKTYQRSTSFQAGRSEKSYKIELIELEEPIQITEIELNGESFDVINYKESIVDGTVSKQGVIKVSNLDTFRQLFSEKSINVLRVGVDDEPVLMRFGSLMHWSKHTEGDEVYYKQIFRLFDIDLESPKKLSVANAIHQNNLKSLTVHYALKFETLLHILKEDENLSEATKQKLKAFEIDEEIGNQMFHTMHENFDLVKDAQEHL